MRLQYEIGYKPPNSEPGKHHATEINAEDKNLIVRQSRQGYNTPKRTTRESLVSQSPYRACLRPSLTYHRVESL